LSLDYITPNSLFN